MNHSLAYALSAPASGREARSRAESSRVPCEYERHEYSRIRSSTAEYVSSRALVGVQGCVLPLLGRFAGRPLTDFVSPCPRRSNEGACRAWRMRRAT